MSKRKIVRRTRDVYAERVIKRNKSHFRGSKKYSCFGAIDILSSKQTRGEASCVIRHFNRTGHKFENRSLYMGLSSRLQSKQMYRIAKRKLRNSGLRFSKLKYVEKKTWYVGRFRSTYVRNNWFVLVGAERDFEVIVDFLSYNRARTRCKMFTLQFKENLIKFNVTLDCGCCDADLYFRSEEEISEAFRRAEENSSGVIYDALGDCCDNVDIESGWSRSDN